MKMTMKTITNSFTEFHKHGPSIAVTWSTISGLLLVAPLEHSAGLALNLNWWHAWTITCLVEGAAATAILSGHYVYPALALTGSSTLLGALWSVHAIPHTQAYVLASGLTVLVFTSLILVHVVRNKILDKRNSAKMKEHETLELAKQNDHKRQLEIAEKNAELERERTAADERQQAEQRRHEAELVRAQAYAEQERERLAITREREQAATEQARAEHERQRADAERARADHEREQARREQQQAEHERQQAERDRAQAYDERLSSDREFAYEQWIIHKWSSRELSTKLHVSEVRARAIINEWQQLSVVKE